MDYKLSIGDVVTSGIRANYICFGLGSCIGLFIQDRLTGLTGGAHILLPDNEEGPVENLKFYNVVSAIGELMNQLKSRGSELSALRAKITGGANVLNISTQTGARNVKSVLTALTEHRIFIAAIDVGGTYSRTARFESETGLLIVRKPEINEYKTY